MNARILLVDNHALVREGLHVLLDKQPNCKVVGEADNGRTATRLARDLSPDVIIMDTDLPELDGIEATRQIVSAMPDIKIIALSAHSNRQAVVGMLKAGAKAVLSKGTRFDELVTALTTVMSGRVYLSPQIAHHFVDEYLNPRTTPQSSLTPREQEILCRLAAGDSAKEIALSLHLSEKTVNTHRQHIMHKLNLESFADLVKYAIRTGLTTLDQ